MSSAPVIFPVPISVLKLDGSTEPLSIVRLSLRNLYTWTHHLANDRLPELVALTAGKPIEWVDTIVDESFAALSAKCIELNFPRAMTLGKTDPIIAAKLSPLLNQFAEVLKQSPLAGMTLKDLLPALPPSESAEAIPPASST